MKLVWKLLRQHISIPQFVGFFFANLVGVVIILLGVQFYNDYKALDQEDSFMKADYLIVNKKIGTLSGLTGASNTFSKDEIEELGSEDFVERIGAFTPSSFSVKARFDVEGFVNFSTEMFFESVPDEFVDVKSDAWDYQEGSGEIPIILPKNYLDLYNFGYAQGKGLPKLTEGILGAMKLNIQIEGNGNRDSFDGRIVGFSNRLNTVIVPEEFMEWANQRYGTETQQQPQRLIVEVSSPGDVKIEQYMDEHHYEVAGDKMSTSKANYFLTVISGIVIAVGIIISLLSFFVLMLSIYLLLQKNTQKIQDLLLLGYSPAQVSKHYILLVVGLNAAVLVLAIILMLIGRLAYMDMIHAFGVSGSGIGVAILVGLIIMGAITAGNIHALRSKINSLWLHEK